MTTFPRTLPCRCDTPTRKWPLRTLTQLSSQETPTATRPRRTEKKGYQHPEDAPTNTSVTQRRIELSSQFKERVPASWQDLWWVCLPTLYDMCSFVSNHCFAAARTTLVKFPTVVRNLVPSGAIHVMAPVRCLVEKRASTHWSAVDVGRQCIWTLALGVVGTMRRIVR